MLEVVDENPGIHNLAVDAELAEKVSAISGAHVLVVEDSKINQQIALELLSQAGIEVSFAENGMDAIAIVEGGQFDAVLMDLQMPVMDGFEATQILRVLHSKEDLPIIAMTADTRSMDRDRCLSVGMNDHIVKSVQPEGLYSTLTEWIRPKKMPADGLSAIKTADEDELAWSEELVGIDIHVGMTSVNGNVNLLKKLLVEFYDDHHQDAVRARQALNEGDWVVVQRIAHTLLSTSASLGAKGINELAAQLDEAVRAEKTESYDGLLAWLEMALEPTMASLLILKNNEVKQDVPRKSGPEDREKILHLIENLARMLNSLSADAEEVAIALHHEFNDESLRKLSSQLIDELAVFDFDAAGITLNHLVSTLEKVSH